MPQETLYHQQVRLKLVQTGGVRVAEQVGVQVHLEPPSCPRHGLGDDTGCDAAPPFTRNMGSSDCTPGRVTK